ncbi:MAG TPA: bifunctional UDP-sugar hydrolase/5'-nucleotidase [Ktedonobacteraceae bacterium]|nr:bifunctional UDP-sugar hydrolase/5'-nucleotidase [Ktedonobacteraceae bacterium]
MQSLIILHSNDIHGRIEGLARIATLVEQVRAEHPGIPVLYVDGGDIEETAEYISNVTRGVAMHRLLSVASCQVATVGNGGILRYGFQLLEEYAAGAEYPLLLANLQTARGDILPGTVPTTILEAGSLRIGFIGVTATMSNIYETYFGLRSFPEVPLVRELATKLRQQGANSVILLSHLGLPDDRLLAEAVQGDIDLIIGAHTHDVLPEGEWIGKIPIAQAGMYAEYLGRIDMQWDGTHMAVQRMSLIPVIEDIPQAARVLEEKHIIEQEVQSFLNESVGDLAEPLDFATDRECGTANLAADMLRERMHADIGLITASVGMITPLSAGPLTRKTLWDACPSPANPGVTHMTGAQLTTLIMKGLDPEFAKDTPRAMRGMKRGLIHLSGAVIRDGRILIHDEPIEPERTYRVAASDWELGTYGGCADAAWELNPTYDIPVIIREALEDYLQHHRPVHVTMGRL